MPGLPAASGGAAEAAGQDRLSHSDALTATEQAIQLDPRSQAAWARHAFALARTDRVSDAIGAAERALDLNGHDPEVAELLRRLRAAQPRVLPAA